jgi:hypothetical protein
MNKPDLIVTSCYNDSYQDILNFSKKYNINLLVYIKDDNLLKNTELVNKVNDLLTLISIPNYGRCDYSFIYYIINNYNSLPEKILFTKANFKDQKINLDFCCNTEDYKYMNIGKALKYVIYNKNYDLKILLNKGINKKYIETQFKTKNDNNDPCFRSYLSRDFYNMVYDEDYPTEPIINFGHGPCFCVSKELILKHKKDIYEKLLNTFYPDMNHWDK